MHVRTTTVSIVLSAAAALPVVAGPLAGAAVADAPRTVRNTVAVVPFTFVPISETTHGNTVVTVFSERSRDTGDLPGTGTTTWTCARHEGSSTSRCTGTGSFLATGTISGPADVRLTATCTQSGAFPTLLVTCEGHFRFDGRGALEGLFGQGTWQSSGLLARSVTGTSELRLHDHRR